MLPSGVTLVAAILNLSHFCTVLCRKIGTKVLNFVLASPPSYS
jgi:hypothetical protein